LKTKLTDRDGAWEYLELPGRRTAVFVHISILRIV